MSIPCTSACRSALVLALLSAWLTACSGGLRSVDPPAFIYTLATPAAATVAEPAQATLPYVLTVLTPAVQPGLAQDGIALITADRRLDYFANSRWPDALPRVVGALIVQTLRGSGAIATVSDDTTPFAADYLLRVDVSQFEAHYTGAATDAGAVPTVQVRLECTLARRIDRVVVASFVARGAEAATENRMAAVVLAFDRASQAALSELRGQTLQALAAQKSVR